VLEGMDVVTFFFFSIRLSSLLDITIMHLRYLILFNIIMSAGSINYSVFFIRSMLWFHHDIRRQKHHLHAGLKRNKNRAE
jgi:hypothetical protein